MDQESFKEYKQQARELYTAQKTLFNPYFQCEVVLGAQGFNHLCFLKHKQRPEKEQLFKFKWLALGLEIIRTSATTQEYRTGFHTVGKKGSMKKIQYWGMVAIVGENNLKIRVVLRKVGNGKITFWSVMPYSRIRSDRQRIYDEGIEDD